MTVHLRGGDQRLLVKNAVVLPARYVWNVGQCTGAAVVWSCALLPVSCFLQEGPQANHGPPSNLVLCFLSSTVFFPPFTPFTKQGSQEVLRKSVFEKLQEGAVEKDTFWNFFIWACGREFAKWHN